MSVQNLEKLVSHGSLNFDRALLPGSYWFVWTGGRDLWLVYLATLRQLGVPGKFSTLTYEVMSVPKEVSTIAPVWLAIEVTETTLIDETIGEVHEYEWGQNAESLNAFADYEWLKLQFKPKYEQNLGGYIAAVGDVGMEMLSMVADGAIVLSDEAFRVVEHVVEKAADAASVGLKKVAAPVTGLLWAGAALAAGVGVYFFSRKGTT